MAVSVKFPVQNRCCTRTCIRRKQKGNEIFPVIVLDTGGVRLQEANYGLLSISEIGNVIIALKQYVPVIGLIPGRVGSFGGMSITSALMSYLIATKSESRFEWSRSY